MSDVLPYFSYIPKEITIEIVKLILDRKQFGILMVTNKYIYSIVVSLISVFDDIKTTHDSLLCYFIKITSLNLYCNKIITDGSVMYLTNLTSLNLDYNHTITNNSIITLSNLTSLDLYYNHTITDESIMGLTNLTSLDLCYNKTIIDESLVSLTNLT